MISKKQESSQIYELSKSNVMNGYSSSVRQNGIFFQTRWETIMSASEQKTNDVSKPGIFPMVCSTLVLLVLCLEMFNLFFV